MLQWTVISGFDICPLDHIEGMTLTLLDDNITLPMRYVILHVLQYPINITASLLAHCFMRAMIQGSCQLRRRGKGVFSCKLLDLNGVGNSCTNCAIDESSVSRVAHTKMVHQTKALKILQMNHCFEYFKGQICGRPSPHENWLLQLMYW